MILSSRDLFTRDREVEVTHLQGGANVNDPIVTPAKHWPGPGELISWTQMVRGPMLCYGCGDLWPCRMVQAAEAIARDRERADWPETPGLPSVKPADERAANPPIDCAPTPIRPLSCRR